MAAGCSIPFSLNTTNTANVDEAKGRYKLKTSNNWINFSIDLNNVRTPIIAIQGDYDLQVSVRQLGGQWSSWYSSEFFIECNSSSSPIILNNSDIEFTFTGLNQSGDPTIVLINHTIVPYTDAQDIQLTEHEVLFNVQTTIEDIPNSPLYDFTLRAANTEVLSGSGNLSLQMVVPNIPGGYTKVLDNIYVSKLETTLNIIVETHI